MAAPKVGVKAVSRKTVPFKIPPPAAAHAAPQAPRTTPDAWVAAPRPSRATHEAPPPVQDRDADDPFGFAEKPGALGPGPAAGPAGVLTLMGAFETASRLGANLGASLAEEAVRSHLDDVDRWMRARTLQDMMALHDLWALDGAARVFAAGARTAFAAGQILVDAAAFAASFRPR